LDVISTGIEHISIYVLDGAEKFPPLFYNRDLSTSVEVTTTQCVISTGAEWSGEISGVV
jgi:hypothetical protein